MPDHKTRRTCLNMQKHVGAVTVLWAPLSSQKIVQLLQVSACRVACSTKRGVLHLRSAKGGLLQGCNQTRRGHLDSL